jgi:hypothetical protein
MMKITRMRAITSVWNMSRIPASMLVVVSTIVVAAMPSGMRFSSRAIAALTFLPTSTALLPGCW